MSKRILLAFFIVILITVAIMQNPEEGDFKLIFISAHLPKLIVLTAMSAGGFIAGVLVTMRSSKRHQRYEEQQDNIEDGNRPPDTLSAEDRDYISEP